ncbi:MAG: ABC transporter permease [Anaerolineae bacterium]|nr:ABC transporter permease [Anaerolineae bacterium]
MLKAMRTVFTHEALDLLRDRRALFFLFAVPLVAPILGAGAGMFILWQVARQAGEGIPIVVVNGEQLPGLVDRLEQTRMLELVGLPSDPEKALQSGELLAVLEVPPNAAEALAAEEQVSLRLTSSRSGWLPDFAVLAIEGALADYGDEVLAERLDKRELGRSWLEPVRLDREVAAPTGVAAAPIAGEAGPSSLGSIFLPLAVASWAFSGGLNLMAAMTVGEKERRTMEPLLVTPASRIGIVLGKIALSILVSAITVGLWSLDSLGYTFLLSTVPAGLGGLTASFVGQLGNLGLAMVWLVLLMLPFMTMANGLVAAVCTFAKNYRESNLFLGFFQLLLPGATLLAIFGIGASPPVAVYALPVAGVLVAMRDLFGGGVAPGALALAWAAAALYAAGAVLLAAYVFSREWALMRGV